MASGVETLLLEVRPVLIIAAVVGIFVAKGWEFPDTVTLLVAGLIVSGLIVITDILAIDIRLSHDIIFLVLAESSVAVQIHVLRSLREIVASADTLS